MNDQALFEQARVFLPKYLSPDSQQQLWDQLRSFPPHRAIYSSTPARPGDILQGDGWRGFVAINFDTLERKATTGVVVSNSCDVNAENQRALTPNILFAPMFALSRYVELLQTAGQTAEQIESYCSAIRDQRVASIFYLPELSDVFSESIAILADIRGHPLDHFMRADGKTLLFRLNQFGFYLFLFKLSIHFMRMQEDIAR